MYAKIKTDSLMIVQEETGYFITVDSLESHANFARRYMHYNPETAHKVKAEIIHFTG